MINMNNSIFQASSWKKIKSKYILSQIFENLKQKKLLNTIRYNKNIKIKLKKNKRDYIREYSKNSYRNNSKRKCVWLFYIY